MKDQFKQAKQAYLSKHKYERMEPLAALFDMDGVLYDSMPNHAYSWHETMKHFGMNLPYEEAYMHEGRTGKGTINIVSMRDRGYEVSDEEAASIYEYKSMLFNNRPEAQPMPYAYELLCAVKQSKLIPMIVTGSGQLTLLERLNTAFPQIFKRELMITAFDVKHGKPNPEPYLMGLQKSQCTANQAIVIENAPLGIQAAVGANIFTIAVNTGPLSDDILLDAGADLLFSSIQDLYNNWQELISELSKKE